MTNQWYVMFYDPGTVDPIVMYTKTALENMQASYKTRLDPQFVASTERVEVFATGKNDAISKGYEFRAAKSAKERLG